MGRIIIILAAGLLLYIGWRWLTAEYAKKGRPFAVKALLVGIAVLLIGLAAIGRAHWVGAALASLLAVLRFCLPMLLKSLPFLQQIYSRNAHRKTEFNNVSSSELSVNEALDILGLTTESSKEDIIAAHRKLIQKLHPDRGGNEYLASRVNAAKDLLLAQV